MFFIDWWNSLGSTAQIFACMALPATLVLVVQTVMMFIGFGEDTDGIGDGDIDDIGDFNAETDLSDGVFGEDTPAEVHDALGLEGLRIFTVRGIVAFFVVFGWIGVVMDLSGISLYVTLPVAALCGLAMMLLIAFIFRAVMKLRNDGNTDNRNAIGTAGKVHLTIPAQRYGEGKVHVMLQGAYVERNAVTDDEEPIPTGAEVIVVGTSGQTDLVVKRK
jgi:membrane protein implicated in regulation of membrane protease activity